MCYPLRTLIVLAFLPPMMAVGWWSYAAWKAEQVREQAYREMVEALYASRRLPDVTEPAEIFAWLLPRAPMIGAVVALAFFVAVVVVAVSSRRWEGRRPISQ